MKNFSPIILFVFNRPEHTRKTINALRKNYLAKESHLFVYADGPRSNTADPGVENVRKIIRQIDGFKEVTIVERSENYGLSRSIISGVTEIVRQYGKVIVLEDDLVTSSYFLTYMNESLEKYADDDHVCSIHGYVPRVKAAIPETFFLRGADCWGWATWRHGWAHFNPDGQYLLDELKRRKLILAFNFNGAYSFSEMLQRQIKGANDSWAVRWYASAFLADKLTLHPGRSLVQNIGKDGSGTHCGKTSKCDVGLSLAPINLQDIPVVHSRQAAQAVERSLRDLLGWRKLIPGFVKTCVKSLLPTGMLPWVRKIMSVLD